MPLCDGRRPGWEHGPAIGRQRIPCTLPAGHDGDHRNALGDTWPLFCEDCGTTTGPLQPLTTSSPDGGLRDSHLCMPCSDAGDPTPAPLSRQHRLPDYAATGPLSLILVRMGLDVGDPRDVLLAAVYQLAARMERRTPPWNTEADPGQIAHAAYQLSTPQMAIHLGARIGGPHGLEDGVL